MNRLRKLDHSEIELKDLEWQCGLKYLMHVNFGCPVGDNEQQRKIDPASAKWIRQECRGQRVNHFLGISVDPKTKKEVGGVVHRDWIYESGLFGSGFGDSLVKRPNARFMLDDKTRDKIRKTAMGIRDAWIITKVKVVIKKGKRKRDGTVTPKTAELVGFDLKGQSQQISRQWFRDNFYETEKKFYINVISAWRKKQKYTEVVPIGKQAKRMSALQLTASSMSTSPAMKVQSCDESACVFASLASSLFYRGDTKMADLVKSKLDESSSKVGLNRLDFATQIIRTKGTKYQVKKLEKKFDVLTDISSDVTLCQLIDSIYDGTHCVTVCDKWIFDANMPYALPLTKESLDQCVTMCSKSNVEFLCVGKALRYTPPKMVSAPEK